MHTLSQESNFGNYGPHKWIRQLGKVSRHGFKAQGEIMLREVFGNCPLACFIPCFLEMVFIFLIFHQWYLFILYGKCEPGQVKYQQDFEVSRQDAGLECCV